MIKWRSLVLFPSFLLCASAGFAQDIVPSQKSFYLLANAGVFQGTFNSKYPDTTDLIAQNIADTVQQQGYTGGLGLGYSKIICQKYFLGVEFVGGWMSGHALYQAGAATSAFADRIRMESYLDLTFVPGVFLTPSTATYIKVGGTRANFSDQLKSPVGFEPTYVNTHSSQQINGFTFSLGLKKWLSSDFAAFAEYNYRDYGTVNFPSFQNFTATYSHSAKIYTQSVLLGLTYQIA